jgi:predicted ATPase
MIKSLKAIGVNRSMSFDLQFHEDINVVTGKNGSGKTTILKLLWYAISGNLERIIPEIEFESFEVETDKVFVRMLRETRQKRAIIKLSYRIGDGDKKELEKPVERSGRWDELMEVNRQVARASGSSVFFPTFRRIEGGFSISARRDEEIVRYMEGGIIRTTGVYLANNSTAIQQAMNELSERVSVGAHRFVASISTDDINRLVTSKYAEISEKNNRLHMDLSRFILRQVGEKASSPVGTGAVEVADTLDDIRQRARHVTQESDALLRPFTVLSDLMIKIFQHKGIKLAGPVTLGEARDAISSDVLSAGEKQMLSFLCYNAFANQTSIFIDEPEISLHVDWQRILFPILLQQSTGNQFIVATHSPFIYSKYADKELVLAPDRGDQHADALIDREGDNRLLRAHDAADIIS